MYTKSILIGASLVAAVSAGPLPQSVATKLAGQEGVPTHFPAPAGEPISDPGGQLDLKAPGQKSPHHQPHLASCQPVLPPLP